MDCGPSVVYIRAVEGSNNTKFECTNPDRPLQTLRACPPGHAFIPDSNNQSCYKL